MMRWNIHTTTRRTSSTDVIPSRTFWNPFCRIVTIPSLIAVSLISLAEARLRTSRRMGSLTTSNSKTPCALGTLCHRTVRNPQGGKS